MALDPWTIEGENRTVMARAAITAYLAETGLAQEVERLRQIIEQWKHEDRARFDHIALLRKDCETALAEAKKWRSHHDHQVAMKRTVHERYESLRRAVQGLIENQPSVEEILAEHEAALARSAEERAGTRADRSASEADATVTRDDRQPGVPAASASHRPSGASQLLEPNYHEGGR